ncbi:MAG TPA: metallophosphoesterase family protein [Gemmatimonadales bacterium]|nr:metallophosphoesterase family protein [Gemmatimonadales bacterium]
MKINRRNFLAGLGAAGAAIVADAFAFESHRVLVSRHDVTVPGLPGALHGLRIAQISDVHLPGNQLAARATLNHVRRERPEIVVLNGDMTETARAMGQVTEFARAVRGTLATVAVLGNWEYRAGLEGDSARKVYQEAGVDLLVNQSKLVEVGTASLALVGLDDMLAGRPDLSAARANISANVEIWLIHEPNFADQIPRSLSGTALLLAGHTHGGQIRIPLLPPVKPTGSGRFLDGWYRDTPAPMYVSRGVGTTGIPARFRCPAELPIFTLWRGNA